MDILGLGAPWVVLKVGLWTVLLARLAAWRMTMPHRTVLLYLITGALIGPGVINLVADQLPFNLLFCTPGYVTPLVLLTLATALALLGPVYFGFFRAWPRMACSVSGLLGWFCGRSRLRFDLYSRRCVARRDPW